MVPDRQTSPITFSVPSNGDIMAQPLSIALSMTEWMLGRRRREWLHSGGGMTGKDEVRDIFNGEIANGDLMVDVGALIEFFDVNVEARQDASSIKAILGEEIAIACMKRYFRDQKKSAGLVCVADKPGQRLACTTGGRKGFQLDGWFVVEEKRGQRGSGLTIGHGLIRKRRRRSILQSNAVPPATAGTFLKQLYETFTAIQGGAAWPISAKKPPDRRRLGGFFLNLGG
jgi:hypothetical protein